jgi:N-methylhydantoinase A
MRRGWREEFFNNKRPLPHPLIRRALRRTVSGRLDETGQELEPLDEDGVRKECLHLKSEKVESVAICFMHAWANPEHEKRAAEIVHETFPEAFLTVSSELHPQIRLYERVSTCAFNAYVGPIIRNYLEILETSLRQLGFGGILLIMGSHGGVMSPSVAIQRSASTLLSGPAAAPVAASSVARPHGIENYIVTDMGGTSYDVALIRGGQPLVTQESWLGGHCIALPSLDIHTLGAGGGSIAWVDPGKILHIGPQSAGAHPGPACYGQGGKEPTATDACLALGYLDPEYFLGGKMKLNRKAGNDTIRQNIAEPLGLTTEQAALGMYELICVQMASGIREVTVRRGLDPRDFLMLAAGGAGPLHANFIARELDIQVVMVPNDSSVFCAAGMLTSDLKHDLSMSWRVRFDTLNAGDLAQRLQSLRAECREVLARQGVSPDNMSFEPGMDMRYLGQYHEVKVPLPADVIDSPQLDDILRRFHEHHDVLYGYATDTMPVEGITMRMTGRGSTPKPVANPLPFSSSEAEHARKGERPIRLHGVEGEVRAAVYAGEKIQPGNRIQGPAVVERPNTTILVLDHYELACDTFGHFFIWPQSASKIMRAQYLAGSGGASI